MGPRLTGVPGAFSVNQPGRPPSGNGTLRELLCPAKCQQRALCVKLFALRTVLSRLTIVPLASSRRAEKSVGSIPFEVAPVTTAGACELPALISRNRLPHPTPALPPATW
jgi:hypothetical protein